MPRTGSPGCESPLRRRYHGESHEPAHLDRSCELSGLLQGRRVDMVTPKFLSPGLRSQILVDETHGQSECFMITEHARHDGVTHRGGSLLDIILMVSSIHF